MTAVMVRGRLRAQALPVRTILSEMTKPYAWFEALAYDAVAAPAIWRPGGALEAVGARLVDALPPDPRVLDVGCGGGQLALWIESRRIDALVTGVDLSPEQVARASRRADRARCSAQFVRGSAMDLPFPDGSFDAVVSIASIKHWPDRARGLRECTRVLADGGMLLVVEADRDCLLPDARAFVARMRIPRPLLPAALMAFRTFVAGQGLDADDGRALFAQLPLEGAEVVRMAGVPAILMHGRKRPGPRVATA